MASLLFTVGGAVVNALAFSGTNFFFSKLTYHGKEELKKYDLALINKRLLSTKDYVKKMRQGHISTILMKQYLSTIEYLENK